jgi:hypothetical protein
MAARDAEGVPQVRAVWLFHEYFCFVALGAGLVLSFVI